MRKRIVSMRVKYELLQQSWLTQKDVMNLAECGPVRAAEIRQEIAQRIKPKTLPERIPTSLVVEYLDIDVAYITKVASFSLVN